MWTTLEHGSPGQAAPQASRYRPSRYGTRFNKAREVTANKLDNKIVYYKEQLSVDT
jgi:hypothetical protein